MSPGMSVGGPQKTTSAPRVFSPQALERATRLNRMSPTMATRSPLISPKRWRMVNMSRSACVGCSCAPSPALRTMAWVFFARKAGTPAPEWRTTTRSIFIDSMLWTVSSSVSPLEMELPEEVKLIRSALSRFSASSKEMRVRVLFSKKRLTMVVPRSEGTFFTGRSSSSRNDFAVSRIA